MRIEHSALPQVENRLSVSRPTERCFRQLRQFSVPRHLSFSSLSLVAHNLVGGALTACTAPSLQLLCSGLPLHQG